MQSQQQLKRIRKVEKITHDIRPRRKTQQLGTLSKIMRPTWNNIQQPSGKFIKNFQNWRDEIYNYDNTVSEIASTMKMALFMQNIQADFDDAATKVEDYRKVYIDNNNPGGIQALGKPYKPWKCKGP
eukprot:306747-Amphidinium_carterae.1